MLGPPPSLAGGEITADENVHPFFDLVHSLYPNSACTSDCTATVHAFALHMLLLPVQGPLPLPQCNPGVPTASQNRRGMGLLHNELRRRSSLSDEGQLGDRVILEAPHLARPSTAQGSRARAARETHSLVRSWNDCTTVGRVVLPKSDSRKGECSLLGSEIPVPSLMLTRISWGS